MIAPRLLVVLGKGASAEIVEEFGAGGQAGRCFTNAVAEIYLGEDASLKHGCRPVSLRRATAF